MATFELYTRRLHPQRGYWLACGLELALEYLEGLHVSQEQLGWLRAQLADLSANERLLLQQRFGGESSLGEVATALGLSADAVHGRVRRLLLRLRRAAGEWFGDG